MRKVDVIGTMDRMIRDLEEMKRFYEKAIARGENDEALKEFLDEMGDDYDPWKQQVDDNADYLLTQVDNAMDEVYCFLQSYAEDDIDVIYEC